MTRSRLTNPSFHDDAIAFSGVGGVVTEYITGGTHYRVHSFTAAGTHKIRFNHRGTIDFLIVGGGGGSAAAEGNTGSTGGAGGGGMVEGTSQTITNGSYSVVVGVGGARSTNVANPGSTGGDSTFNGYVAKGGAAGPDYGTHGGAGGCGAGGSEDLRNAGSSNQDPYSSTTNVAGYGHGGGAAGKLPANTLGGVT